jgi:hypothetical protein
VPEDFVGEVERKEEEGVRAALGTGVVKPGVVAGDLRGHPV